MAEINSDDYHDYVFKNGKLVGEFEQMYRKSKNTPWHQDEQENWLDVRLTIELIKEYGSYDMISDFGVGYGYFLNKVARCCGTENPILYGYDISETACKKGKILFPHITFRQLNLMAANSVKFQANRIKGNKAIFLLRGTLWYVFPAMDNVVRNITNLIDGGGYLLISQNFPPLSSNFIGKDIIPNPQAIISFFSSFFKPLKTIWLEDKISDGNDNWFITIMERL